MEAGLQGGVEEVRISDPLGLVCVIMGEGEEWNWSGGSMPGFIL